MSTATDTTNDTVTVPERTTDMTTTAHTTPTGLPPGFGASCPEPDYTFPAARSVNHLLGMLSNPAGFMSGEAPAELLRRHTVGRPPGDAALPRRVAVNGETAVIGRQHRGRKSWAGVWVRFDWLRTHAHISTLAQALKDPRTRPGAVADFGGGQFILAKTDYDQMLLFVPTGGGVAIDIGDVSYNAAHTDFELGAYGLTRDDIADRGDARGGCSFECVLGDYGPMPLEGLF